MIIGWRRHGSNIDPVWELLPVIKNTSEAELLARGVVDTSCATFFRPIIFGLLQAEK
uniref:Uncharacterized protein n=1 Tax=Candidatus Kentrum sp. DK TaxID=2126562 RepID=A0A450TQF8_9GAMM|nr:MAG: hypothetical protein BECKDK2373C_GA0170839_10718 [Candidatus Kentron sp. DK]VFJ70198.1 MAG: hypothetical protein BECKDK2373B_GA0170837_12703 [Candidatus Kentron sp. DK]